MKIEARREDANLAVLEIEGRLTIEAGANCLSNAVDALLQRGVINIVMNMVRVDSIDCSGIGQLVVCRCRVDQRGGALKLACVGRRVRELIELFRLESALEIHASERSAVASLMPPKAPRLIADQPYINMWGTDLAGGSPGSSPIWKR